MMHSERNSNLTELIERIRDGCDEAAAELFEIYGPELRREIRYFLRNPRLKAIEDSQDVLQSVMRCLFMQIQAGHDTIDAKNLSSLLCTMAERKSTNVVRRQYAAKRNARLKVPIDDNVMTEHVANVASPSKQIERRELFEQIMNGLNGRDRQLVDAYCHGHSWVEIGALLKETPNAVRKRFQRLCDQLQRERLSANVLES